MFSAIGCKIIDKNYDEGGLKSNDEGKNNKNDKPETKSIKIDKNKLNEISKEKECKC